MSFVKSLSMDMNLILLIACLGSQVAQSKPIEDEPAASSDQRARSRQAAAAHTQQSAAPAFDQDDHVRAMHYHFDQEMEPFMELVKFSQTSTDSTKGGNNVTCNDGSPTGYYKRLNNHSKTWIIYLQGGGYCGSEQACQMRWRRSAHLMSSNYWPRTISAEGILSSEAKENPYLWNTNHIYVPYCSSDSWTGLQEARPERSSFAFMGSKIIEKVLDSLFDDLPRESSLFEAKFILFAGDSAGATGVILNLDKLNRLVQQRFDAPRSACPHATAQLCADQKPVPIIRGLADSGWFLDNEPYDVYQQQLPQESQGSSMVGPDEPNPLGSANEPVDCDKQRCSPLQSIKQAMLHWNGQVPVSCAHRQMGEPWRCYFAYRAYATLRTPLFVVQWLYDEAQLLVDNIIRPDSISQWTYVNKLVNEMRTSLENVSALFAPSCFSHSLIIKRSWNQININGFKLPHVLNSWEEETLPNQPTYNVLLRDQLQEPTSDTNARNNQFTDNNNQLGTTAINRDQLYDRIISNQQHYTQGIELRSAIPRSSTSGNSQPSAGFNSRPRSRKKKRNNSHNGNSNLNSNRVVGNANRLSRSTILDDMALLLNNNMPDPINTPMTRLQEIGSEKFRLIDTCGWPQCNRDCPNLDLDLGLRSILAF